jgi:hypothetical protein
MGFSVTPCISLVIASLNKTELTDSSDNSGSEDNLLPGLLEVEDVLQNESSSVSRAFHHLYVLAAHDSIASALVDVV